MTRVGDSDQLQAMERVGRTVYPFIGPETAEHLAAGLVVFPPASEPPPHVHETEEELIYVLEGDGEILLDGKLHKLVAGRFIYVTPGTSHQVINRGAVPLRLLYAFSPPTTVGTWD